MSESSLQNPVNISKLPMNTPKQFKLTQDQDWVAALLRELNENSDETSELREKTHLTLDLELTKKFDDSIGELVIVTGSFGSQFATKCVKTYQDMLDNVLGKVQACFIPKFLEKEDAYQDQTDIFINNDMHELYFHDRGRLDLAEALHEQIYLEVNQYPSLDE